MQKSYKPIRRSRELAGLSREHHDSLLFVWKIRQGISYKTDLTRIAAYCEFFWETNMKDHVKKEETAVRMVLPAGHPLRTNLLEDHEAIRNKIREVTDEPSYTGLSRLAQIIYYHVRFEERTLFPHVEQVSTPRQMEELGALLSDAHSIPENWPDEFWVKKKSPNEAALLS